MNNLTKEELEKLYDEILFKLTAPFPEGTVEFKGKGDSKASAYIPSHAINYRLRTEAGPYWSWRLSTQNPIYHEETDEIEVRGVLTILTASSEGQGFATLNRGPDKKIQYYKESIRAATSDALRDAADFYGIGHISLAPYRKWASNPGAGLVDQNKSNNVEISVPTQERTKIKNCLKCGVVLSREDLDYLELVRWKNLVCKSHVPDHQKKKFDPNYQKKVN